jgi:uncharacterized protein YndB with AHSA1/START domain
MCATRHRASTLPRPDLTTRRHRVTVERDMRASPSQLYWAWTDGFETWFATPGRIWMRAEVDQPYYFEVEQDGDRHPHYGRFLTLDPDERIEMTWVNGKGGTDGAETVVTIELIPKADGTRVRLTHAGFYDSDAADHHEAAWPRVLAHLDEELDEPA